MYQKSASNNDSKQCDMAEDSNLVMKYKPLSGQLHEHCGI